MHIEMGNVASSFNHFKDECVTVNVPIWILQTRTIQIHSVTFSLASWTIFVYTLQITGWIISCSYLCHLLS